MKKINSVCIIDDDSIFVYIVKRLMDESNFCDSIIEFDSSGDILFYNKKASEIYELDKNPSNSDSIYNLFPDNEKEGLTEAISKAEIDGSSFFISKAITSGNCEFIEIEVCKLAIANLQIMLTQFLESFTEKVF